MKQMLAIQLLLLFAQYHDLVPVDNTTQYKWQNLYSAIVWLGGAVVRALDLRLKGRGFKSQLLHCRVQLWTSCSHTLSSASGVTTLWRYINQFNLKKQKQN